MKLTEITLVVAVIFSSASFAEISKRDIIQLTNDNDTLLLLSNNSLDKGHGERLLINPNGGTCTACHVNNELVEPEFQLKEVGLIAKFNLRWQTASVQLEEPIFKKELYDFINHSSPVHEQSNLSKF